MGDLNRIFFHSNLIKHLNKRKVTAFDNSWTRFNCVAIFFSLAVNMNYLLVFFCVCWCLSFFFLLFFSEVICYFTKFNQLMVSYHQNEFYVWQRKLIDTNSGQRNLNNYFLFLYSEFIKCSCSIQMFHQKNSVQRQTNIIEIEFSFDFNGALFRSQGLHKSHYWAIIAKQVDERLTFWRFSINITSFVDQIIGKMKLFTIIRRFLHLMLNVPAHTNWQNYFCSTDIGVSMDYSTSDLSSFYLLQFFTHLNR